MYYYEGADGQTIRALTRQKVLDKVTAILTALGHTVGNGDGQFALLKTREAAAARYKAGQPFLYFARRTVKVTPKRVVDGGGAGHPGRKYEWGYLILVSQGNIGGNTTSEQSEASTDTLMDQVRDALEESYTYFRDLNFYKFAVGQLDDNRETGLGVEPILITFYNTIRLQTEEAL
jgi:hypothetical protein